MLLNEQKRFVEELYALTKDATISNRAQEMALLVPKWEKTGLLEGLSPINKTLMAGVLQNEALIVKKTLHEATDTTDIAGFNKIAFPLVRKTFDKLIAQELVSFQTMNLPSGLVFYQDFQFETTKPGFTAGNPIYQNLDTSVSGILGGRGAGQAAGGFYGSDYNVPNNYSKNVLTSGTLSVSADTATQVKVPWPSLTAGFAAGADESMPLFVSGTGSQDVKCTFASWTGANAYFDLPSGSTTAAISATMPHTTAVIKYIAKTDVNNRGDFESSSAIPSMNMRIASIPVTATTRKLKAGWTQEGAQDIMSYHGIDAEVELTSTLSDMISMEINNNILSDLLLASRVSGNRDFWSYKLGEYVDTTGATITSLSTAITAGNYLAFHGTQAEWSQTLVAKISKVSNQIYKKTFRGEANFLVVSPEIASILEQTLAWKTFQDGPQKYGIGIEKVGTLANKLTIFKHATFPADKILLIYKGDQWLDTGYVYAPYIMSYMTPVIYDMNTFEPRKMIMTRDARQVIKPEFFASITVNNTSLV